MTITAHCDATRSQQIGVLSINALPTSSRRIAGRSTNQSLSKRSTSVFQARWATPAINAYLSVTVLFMRII